MPSDLREAVGYHRRGDLTRAAELYRAALSRDPDDAEAHYLLGVASLQTGDTDAALRSIERALEVKPDEANYLAALAEVRNAARRFEEVVSLYRRALAQVERADWWSNLGATLVELGRDEEAIEAFSNAIRINFSLAPAHHNLAGLYQHRGELLAASRHVREALRITPNSPDSRSLYSRILADSGDLGGALDQAVQAAALRPDSSELFLALGNILMELGRVDDAGTAYREAVRLKPTAASARAALGGFLEHAGEIEASLAEYREALRLDPNHPGTLARMANRLRGELRADDRARIETHADTERLPSGDRIASAFALAAVDDALGRFDSAANWSEKARRLRSAEFRRRGRSYDPDEHDAYVERIKKTFDKNYFESSAGWGDPTTRPVFVVGTPRSGTTLIEQILSSHSTVIGVGESSVINDLFMEFTDRGRAVAEGMRRLDSRSARDAAARHPALDSRVAGDALRVVDKMPENANALGLIATLFPNARIIECRRDLRDTAVSCLLTDLARVRWACEPEHVARRFASHRDLMVHWHEALPNPILVVDYESVVADLETQARRMIEFCGLEWDPNCLEFHRNRRPVLTASASRVRSPIHSGSVGRWRHYRGLVGPVIERLGLVD